MTTEVQLSSSEQEEINRLYLLVHAELNRYIRAMCHDFSRSFRHLESSDLEQECALKVYDLTKKYRDKLVNGVTQDFLMIARTSIYRRLCDLYREDRTHGGGSTQSIEEYEEIFDSDHEEARDPDSNQLHDIITTEYAQEILQNLDPKLEQKVFLLILRPDGELVKLAQVDADKYTQLREKNDGAYSGGTEQVIIRNAHLAKFLNVSPATISRVVARINRTITNVLRSLDVPQNP